MGAPPPPSAYTIHNHIKITSSQGQASSFHTFAAFLPFWHRLKKNLIVAGAYYESKWFIIFALLNKYSTQDLLPQICSRSVQRWMNKASSCNCFPLSPLVLFLLQYSCYFCLVYNLWTTFIINYAPVAAYTPGEDSYIKGGDACWEI